MPPRLVILFVACTALAACGKAPQGAENAAFTADQQATGRASVVFADQPKPPPSAADFVAKAAASDAFEMQAAQTALQRAADPDVKGYAAQMVRDHTRSSAELKKALAAAGQSLPLTGSPSADQQFALGELARADAASFDKAYMTGQAKAHQVALTLLQNYAQNGDVVSLTAFASQTAPVVQHHYDMATSLRDRLK